MSATVAYVANRQNGMLRNRNVNYGTLSGGAASQPFFPLGINSAMNIFTADGKVKYDSLQLSVNRRMSGGVQFTGRVHVRQDDRLVEDGRFRFPNTST